jgi:hypothetical protein
MGYKYENYSALDQCRKESPRSRLLGAVRGILSGLNARGEPLVDFCGNIAGHAVLAVTTVPVRAEDVGKEAILLFEDGDAARPLLIGVVLPPSPSQEVRVLDIKLDGRSIVMSAEHDISIRCGEASISLTRAGKVIIKGTSLLSKSAGPNRIKGGCIQLN